MELKVGEIYLSRTTNKHFIILEDNKQLSYMKVQYLTEKDSFVNIRMWIEKAALPMKISLYDSEMKQLISDELKRTLVYEYAKTI